MTLTTKEKQSLVLFLIAIALLIYVYYNKTLTSEFRSIGIFVLIVAIAYFAIDKINWRKILG